MDHVYTIPGFSISALNEAFVQRHCGTFTRAANLQAASISTGMALFSLPDEGQIAIQTWIIARDAGLYASCSCGAISEKLCLHQARALLAISRQGELRVHFDTDLRNQQLRTFAIPYGLQGEENLDSYFRIDYINGKNTIKPVNPNLFPLSREYTIKLQDSFLGKQTGQPRNHTGETVPLIVFKQHKYYKHLMVELAEAAIAQSGKPKNPVLPLNALEMVWQASTPTAAKFFSAIHFFQQRTVDDQPAASIEALKALFKNPAGFPFYRHDAGIRKIL